MFDRIIGLHRWFNNLITVMTINLQNLYACVLVVGMFVLSVPMYAELLNEPHEKSVVAESLELYTVSLDRIAEKQVLYRAELANNAKKRTFVLVGSGLAVAAVGGYVASSYVFPSVKKAAPELRDASDVSSLDDVYKQLRVKEFLQREEDLKFGNVISSHIKQGVGYAFSTVTAAYLIWLFTDVKDRCFDGRWLSSIYKTDAYDFRLHAEMLCLQMSYLESSLRELAEEFSVLGQGNTIEDFNEFKVFFTAGVVDAHNGLIIALENILAYVLESIARLPDAKKQGMYQYFEAKVQAVLIDLQANHTAITALMTSESQIVLLRNSTIALGNSKKMIRRLGKILHFFGEHVYDLIASSSKGLE